MALSRLKLLFNLLDARVQIVHQILLFCVRGLSLCLRLKLVVRVFYLLLQFLNLLLILLNNFLAEM